MLIGPWALKSPNSIEKIQPRMIVATFNGNPCATIVSCNSSTNISEETDLIAFYNELSSIVRSIPKHNVLVIGKDMNAQIGKNHHHHHHHHVAPSDPLSPFLQAGLQRYIPYQHRAVACRFGMVILPLLVHMKGSTGVHPL